MTRSLSLASLLADLVGETADGEAAKYQAQCDVHAISWESLGMSQTKVDAIEAALQREIDNPALGPQVIVKGSYKIFVDFLAFVPTEVWVAQLPDGTADGTFVQVFDRAVR